MIPFPMGHWQVLAYPQLLETIKNAIGCLDNHKALRDEQELEQG